MKTNIKLLLIIISCSISQNNMAQYYMDPMTFGLQMQQQRIMQQYQQQMNNFYYKITPNYRYITTDGKTLTIEIQLNRTTAFSNVKCYINNQSGTNAKNLEHEIFAGNIIVKINETKWKVRCGDKLTINFDNGKSWTHTFGENYSPQDWSRYCQNQLNKAIDDYNLYNQQVKYQSSSSPTYNNSLPNNPYDNTGNQTATNKQNRIIQINSQIAELQRKLVSAQQSLNLYVEWENKEPSVSRAQLVQSARNLVNTYTQQISNLQMEKANLGY